MRSARRSALEILLKIERQNAYAAPLLARVIPKFDSRDRRLLVELVYGVIRWRKSLDWIIGKVSRYPMSRMNVTILNLLRLGTYQLLFLSRVPPHAVVFSSVEMAKSLKGKKAGGFVNAVLRRVSKRGPAALDLLPNDKTAEALAIRTSHPTWLVKRWISRFGFEETETLCRANNDPPPATLRVNTLKTTRNALLEAAGQDTFFRDTILEPTKVARNGVNVVPLSSIYETDWMERGLVTIQDEASQLVGEIVVPECGDRILDACAGIGIKSSGLLELSKDKISLFCADNIPWKLVQMEDAIRRLSLSTPLRFAASMRTPPLANRPIFDKVLVDAPCSNTGVIRRHPERKWRLKEEDIRRMAQAQGEILGTVAPTLKPGGALIYSTCSLEQEEGEEIVEEFLEQHADFRLASPARFLSETAAPYIHREVFRSFPHRGGMDGFFCARLTRSSS